MRHKCLASLIVFILFFTISAVIGFWQTKKIASPDFVIKTLNESGIYNNLDTLGDLLAQSEKEQSTQAKVYFRALTGNINPTWVQGQVESNLPLFINYLLSNQPALNVVFDLREYKKTLPESFKEALEETVKELPICSQGQVSEQNQDFPSCIPQGTTPEQMAAQLTPEDIQSLVNEIPDTYRLSEVIKNPEQTFGRAKLAFSLMNIGFIVLITISIILLGLLAILGRAYWPSIPRWIGLALALPAGLNLLLDGIWLFLQGSVQSEILKGFNPQFLPVIAPLVETLNRNLIRPGFLISGIIFGAGFILIILSYAIPHPPEPKPVPKPTQSPTAAQK